MIKFLMLGLVTASFSMTVDTNEERVDRQNSFELTIDTVRQKLGEEHQETEDWLRRIEIIERQFHSMKVEKAKGMLCSYLLPQN